MRRYFLLFIICLKFSFYAQILPYSASITQKEWKVNPFEQKYLIENKGQWYNNTALQNPVLFAYDGQNEDYFFSKNSIQINLIKKKWKKKEEKEEHEKNKKWEEEYILSEQREIIVGEWLNANPNVEIIPLEKNTFYCSYSFYKDNHLENINYIPTYNKILYKNIYPNIDIEYTLHPQKGYKYTIIVHPGGDISIVKWKYSKKSKLKNNSIYTHTRYGEIIDHSPIAYLLGLLAASQEFLFQVLRWYC